MSWWAPHLAMFVAALATSLVTTPLARRIAIALDAVDYPSARRINKKPIPRMGGIAVFLALGVAAFVLYTGSRMHEWPPILDRHSNADLDYWRIGLAFAVIFATGAIDDVVQLKPLPKLIGQIVAACVAVSGGLVIGNIVNPVTELEFSLGWFAYPITVVYLVSYSNIINLIDGLDGLATGTSAIASVTMFVLAAMAGHNDATALSAAVAGAALGFLPYNFNPASIFLGDCGALLLGFALGTSALLNVTRMAGLTTIIVPLVIAGIPIIDTLSAIIRRSRAHVSVGQADRGHIHHRLIAEGFDQRQAVLLIYTWNALLCGGAVVMTQVNLSFRMFIFGVLLVASFLFARHLHLFEPVLLHHYNPKTGKDEIVGPDDPAFHEEELREKARRNRKKHLRR